MRAQLRLLGKRDCTLSRYLETRGPVHAQWARDIGPADTERKVYERIMFALLSTNTAFEATCEAFAVLCRGQAPAVDWTCEVSLSTILASVRTTQGQSVAFPNMKARDVITFTRRFATHPKMFESRGLASEWRDRLNIAGLAHMKLSFAAALLTPETADTVCIDRHMQRFLYGRECSPCARRYRESEVSLANVGIRYGLSAFVTQWCVWDWLRAKEEPHDILV